MQKLSLLCPPEVQPVYHTLTAETINDLSVEYICDCLTDKNQEKTLIRNILTELPEDPRIIRYRSDIFEDILQNPALREQLQPLLEKVAFLKEYGSFGKESDASGMWDLIHRMHEIDEYITCVEAIQRCLEGASLHSEGLLGLRDYVVRLRAEGGFEALKQDIANLKVEASRVRSVTMGVNLNERFEPNGVGLISINSKAFTKTGILSNFCDFLSRGDEIEDDIERDPGMSFRSVRGDNPHMLSHMPAVNNALPVITTGTITDDTMRVMDRIVSVMLSTTVRKLKQVLSRHVEVSTRAITALIPEFLYYIRWAEWTERAQAKGLAMCKPELLPPQDRAMQANGLYNWKLARKVLQGEENDIVPNDLDFVPEHRIYILTGANRGGKTTITQAVGIAFLLAQSGVFVPAQRFAFSPADHIYTHFPADENRTMDLGRLGEESKRFREIFSGASANSLILLNESFSTTSFEEGFYIAQDAVRALGMLGARTIYNTHMHKLAADLPQLNALLPATNQAASLVTGMQDGQRSYRVYLAPPQGRSYAYDIARKYGVTFEQLQACKQPDAPELPQDEDAR